MKNRFSAIIASSLVALSLLGCSSVNPFSEPKETRRSPADPFEKDATYRSTGVRECDEVSDLIEAELNSSEDNFIVKAAKATVLNRIKDNIRDSVEKNKND